MNVLLDYLEKETMLHIESELNEGQRLLLLFQKVGEEEQIVKSISS